VKRERGLDDDDDDDDDGFVPRSATAAHRIDLTEEVSEKHTQCRSSGALGLCCWLVL
jgi:hypothetical protein